MFSISSFETSIFIASCIAGAYVVVTLFNISLYSLPKQKNEVISENIIKIIVNLDIVTPFRIFLREVLHIAKVLEKSILLYVENE